MPGSEIFERALRAAAGVTGVLRRGAVIGVAAGALAAAGCEAPPAPSTPSNHPGATTLAGKPPPIDAGPPDARTCDRDRDWSRCCKEAFAANEFPLTCQAWGPPAPPVYRGEVLA